MIEKPTKPITIKVQEFDNNIVNAINTSGLPMWKMRDELEKILKSVYNACAEEEKREIEQYNKEMEEYQSKLKSLENEQNTQE